MRRISSLPRFLLFGLFFLLTAFSFQPWVFSVASSHRSPDVLGIPSAAEASVENEPAAARPTRSRLQTRAQWATPVPISNADPDRPPDNPDVALCPDGTVHVVWEQAGKLWHNYRTPVGTWSGPRVIVAQNPPIPPQELRGNAPAIAATADCQLYLAWSRDWGGASNILFARWDGVTWWGFTDVSKSSAQSQYPDIAVTSFGEPRITWVEGGTLNPSLYWGQRIDGEWTRAFFPSVEFRGFFPKLVFDADDRGHLVWQKLDGQQINVLYGQQVQPARPGQSDVWFGWNLPVSKSPTASSLPRMVIVNGRPLVVWIEKTGESQRAIYGSHAVGPPPLWDWPAPVELSGGHNVKGGNPPAIAAGRTGPAHLAWAEQNPVDAIRYTALWSFGNELLSAPNSSPELITNGGQEHTKPAIATSVDGTRVYLVWLERDANDVVKVYFSESEDRVFNFYIPLITRQER